MKLIVGLGNPGKEYESTRHNAGFLALDQVAHDLSGTSSWSMNKNFNALMAETQLNGKVWLAKPQTYMNLSGESVQAIASYYKIDLNDILIVHDELDLMPGTLAFLAKGGHAGHNGIASIQDKLASQAIQRLRIGIGRPTPPQTSEKWVLGQLEQPTKDTCVRASKAIQDWITLGLDKAMNTWNRKDA